MEIRVDPPGTEIEKPAYSAQLIATIAALAVGPLGPGSNYVELASPGSVEIVLDGRFTRGQLAALLEVWDPGPVCKRGHEQPKDTTRRLCRACGSEIVR
jgi:hypothetical protein